MYFDKEDVTFTQGTMGKFKLRSDAGRWLETRFCTVCGTTVAWTLEFLPDYCGIAGGTFDRPTFWYDVERLVFARTKPDWLTLPDHIESFQRMPG